MNYTLITGASKGIGKAIAFELAAQGQNLLLVARSEELLEQLSKELCTKNIDVKYLSADLLEENAPQYIFDWIELQKLQVNTLINNAGIGLYGRFADCPIDKHMQVMHLNMDAMVRMAYGFLKRTNASQRRYILNNASSGAFQPVPFMAIYCASKAFMLSFSQALRYEVKSQNVYVTALCPGATKSEFSVNAGTSKVEERYASLVMSAESVAKAALKGLWKNKSVVVPGFINQLSVIASQLSPHDIVTAMSANVFKDN
jgi:short-subunit dehydrogenase